METDGGYDRRSPPRKKGAEVIRLRPLCVLIVSRDHRFRAVIEMLMSRRGCSAFSSSMPPAVAETVVDERVDVVLIDGVAALREVAENIARCDASAPPVGVVLVRDGADPVPAGLRSLTKWDDFEELFAAVVEADRARAAGTCAGGPSGIAALELG